MTRPVTVDDVIQPCEWLCEKCGRPFKIGDVAYDDGDLKGSVWHCERCREGDALAVECPRCLQPPHFWCVTKRPRHFTARLHRERLAVTDA